MFTENRLQLGSLAIGTLPDREWGWTPFIEGMHLMLHGSVGAGGRNQRADVRNVQTLLAAGGWHPGLIDGVCGRRTLSAIVAFQRRFMHHPDGLIELNGPTWRMLNHPQHQRTGYQSLDHKSAAVEGRSTVKPAQISRTAPPAPSNAGRFAVTHRAVPEARAIQLTAKDVLDIKKTLRTEWATPAGDDQAYGVIDTILNRLASGHWGRTVASVVNSPKQFSNINGPVAWAGKDMFGAHHSVEEISDKFVGQRVSRLVDTYLLQRAQGRKSIVDTNLDYANPDPRYSSPRNLGWIRALSGPTFGLPPFQHKHGTTPDKARFRPKPYYILLPVTPG